MNDSGINILDLPDEILSKLQNIDVLYSLMGVNDRLDRVVCDTYFTRFVDLAAISSNTENEIILSRFCLEISPRIHQNAKCLTLEPMSMERILLASDYPNLYKLNFVQLEQEQALRYFNGKKFLSYSLCNLLYLDESPLADIFK
jgi:hypothetical protein